MLAPAHLNRLPQLPVALHEEVLALVGRRRLFGVGIGWVDAHLLTASLVAGARLWTLDGLLDEIEIFDRALDASETRAILEADDAGKCKLGLR